MRKWTVFFWAFLWAAAGFSQEPDKTMEIVIKNYLEVLESKNTKARLEALAKVNEFKSQYPNFKMREFDTFMSGKIMAASTKNWLANLSSPNAGVRHSTLHVLVRMKSDFPYLDMSGFNTILKRMCEQDPVAHLQVDAKIAAIYLNSSKLAEAIKIVEDHSPGDTFTQIHLAMDEAFKKENPKPVE
ncbi:MAG TPA: hypothetical protein PK843_08575 [bacterium]|nr:hypothetical protein [bacterium]HPN34555.1 hypothetical protein [bacterium]